MSPRRPWPVQHRRHRRHRGHLVALALAVSLATSLTGCGDDASDTSGPPPTGTAPTTSLPTTGQPDGTEPPSPEPPEAPAPPATPKPSTDPQPPAQDEPFGGRHVVAISIDGLNPDALSTLGREGAPNIWALIDNGAATLDARSEYERTVTLPNHTGMVTGRPIDQAFGGHGVTWNDDQPGRTVQGAAGYPVESVFDVVHDAGGSTAVFAGKTKFSLFETSWPDAIDDSVVVGDLDDLTARVTADLAAERRTFTFVHVAEPDAVGHARGWMTPPYLQAVRDADATVGAISATIQSTPDLAGHTVVVLTADHGGMGKDHSDATAPADYTIPFVLAGDGVRAGDLYALSPGLQDPGTGRPTYDGPQPARNCDLANVSLRALGLRPVADSPCDGYRFMPVRRPR